MIYLTLKFALALILACLPFIFSGMKKSDKDENKSLLYLIAKMLPFIKKAYLKTKHFFFSFRERMRHDESIRKLFTLIVVFFLLAIQFVDSRAMTYAVNTTQEAIKTHTEQKLALYGNINKFGILKVFIENTSRNWLYPYMTNFITYMLALAATLTLLSNKLADKIFRVIKDDNTFVLLSFISGLLLLCDEGRYFLISETIFVFLIAGTYYPNRIYK